MTTNILRSLHNETSSDGRASYHDMTKKLSESTNAPAMKMVENPAVLAAARQPPTSEPSSVVDSIQRLEAIATTTSIHPLVVDCRRNTKRLEGSLALEEFLFSQYYRPGIVSSWTVVFVSERVEAAVTARENQKHYHPGQPVTAFSLDNIRAVELLESIRQQQKASGKLKKFKTGLGGILKRK